MNTSKMHSKFIFNYTKNIGGNKEGKQQPKHSPFKLNLGCLHPIVRVRSNDVGFNPSTQHHYCSLIYYLYIHSYMFRSYDHHQDEIL
jgi:hypothetical protein